MIECYHTIVIVSQTRLQYIGASLAVSSL